LRVKVATAEPSSAFHILADPSVDVEARNSESRLEYDRQTKAYNSATRIDKKKTLYCPIRFFYKTSKNRLSLYLYLQKHISWQQSCCTDKHLNALFSHISRYGFTQHRKLSHRTWVEKKHWPKIHIPDRIVCFCFVQNDAQTRPLQNSYTPLL
jgi:hypothetical protein